MADRNLDYRDIEDEMWNAFYAVQVLADRVDDHFGDAPAGDYHRTYTHDGTVSVFAANQAREKVRVLTERFREIHKAQGGAA